MLCRASGTDIVYPIIVHVPRITKCAIDPGAALDDPHISEYEDSLSCNDSATDTGPDYCMFVQLAFPNQVVLGGVQAVSYTHLTLPTMIRV